MRKSFNVKFSSVVHWQILITYISSVSLQFRACLITDQWGDFRVKNAAFCLHTLFWHFLVAFHQKICVFIIFISFFDEVSNFSNRILTNQKPKFVIINCHWKCMLIPYFEDRVLILYSQRLLGRKHCVEFI